jgi:hypothetical protein
LPGDNRLNSAGNGWQFAARSRHTSSAAMKIDQMGQVKDLLKTLFFLAIYARTHGYTSIELDISARRIIKRQT